MRARHDEFCLQPPNPRHWSGRRDCTAATDPRVSHDSGGISRCVPAPRSGQRQNEHACARIPGAVDCGGSQVLGQSHRRRLDGAPRSPQRHASAGEKGAGSQAGPVMKSGAHRLGRVVAAAAPALVGRPARSAACAGARWKRSRHDGCLRCATDSSSSSRGSQGIMVPSARTATRKSASVGLDPPGRGAVFPNPSVVIVTRSVSRTGP